MLNMLQRVATENTCGQRGLVRSHREETLATMIAEEIDAALINSEALYCLRRHQLVSLCKRHGIKPRGKVRPPH